MNSLLERLPTTDDIRVEWGRRSLLDFTRYTKPDYEVNWHHRVLADYLDRFVAGDIKRLMVFEPPRHGKSEQVSRRLPAYIMGRYPNSSIIACSYSADLSQRMNRDVQRIMDGDAYRRLFPDTRLYGANIRTVAQGTWLRNSDIFEVVGHQGVYRSAGVGGGITGMGCFTAETPIETEWGTIAIGTLCALYYKPRVLAFDHDNGRLCYRRIVFAKEQHADELVEITTAQGKRFRATHDHPVFVPGAGYREAALLAPGDPIIVASDSMPTMRAADGQAQQVLPEVLSRGANAHGAVSVHALWEDIRASGICARASDQEKHARYVLFKALLRGASRSEKCASLPTVRNADAGHRAALLLARMQEGRASSNPQALDNMWMVRHGGSSHEQSDAVLLSNLCRCGAFSAYARTRQSALQNGDELREVVCRDAAAGVRERPAPMRGLSGRGTQDRDYMEWATRLAHESASTSYRPRCTEQCSGQLGNTVYEMPRQASQVGHDTVALVTFLRGRRIPVYDLEVEGRHNFFADQILVHNCQFGIIDDPIKNHQEAESATYREALWEWYTSTFYTRVEKDGGILLTLTRWHEDDLAGRLLALAKENPQADQWVVVRLPAVAEPLADIPEDTRAVGEPLWPNRFSRDALMQMQATLGSRYWESLYQQRPSVTEGAIWKRHYWRVYRTLPPTRLTIQAWDTAFKDSQGADYSVCTTWAAGEHGLYLLDVCRERLEFPQLVETAARQAERYKPSVILVEDHASGQSLIQVLRQETRLPIVGRKMDTSKEVRAWAVVGLAESGRLYVPEGAPWLSAYLGEMEEFPHGKHDDQVDSTTLALSYLRGIAGDHLGPDSDVPDERLPEHREHERETVSMGRGTDLSPWAGSRWRRGGRR